MSINVGRTGKGRAASVACKSASPPYCHAQNVSTIHTRTSFPASQLHLTGSGLIALVAVICVTLGSCWAQSMALMSACDIRISASSASFAFGHTGSAESLSLQLLPKLVGNSSWICDVAFSGREFHASEALRVGFITRVVDGGDEALPEAFKLAEIIAARSPNLVQKSKQALWRIHNIRASKHLLFCMKIRDSSKCGLKSIQGYNQQRGLLTDILRLKWRLIWIKLLGWEHRNGLAEILFLIWPRTWNKLFEWGL